MSKLTTEQALGFIADGLCACESMLEEHHTNGCPQDKAAEEWLAKVRREAKAEELRQAAEQISQLRDVSCMARDGMTDRQAAMERDYQYFRESPVGWLLDRADRMEDGEQ